MAELIAKPIGFVIILLMVVFFIFMGLPLISPGAPFLPSYRKSNPRARAHLKNVTDFIKIAQPYGKFIDLGSGDGRVVIEFARAGFESAGIEFNPILAFWSRFKIKQAGLKNAKVIKNNFWKIDLSNYDIVYIFQLNSVNALLSEKFKKELKPGSIVISMGFIVPDGVKLIMKAGEFLVYKKE